MTIAQLAVLENKEQIATFTCGNVLVFGKDMELHNKLLCLLMSYSDALHFKHTYVQVVHSHCLKTTLMNKQTSRKIAKIITNAFVNVILNFICLMALELNRNITNVKNQAFV